MKTPERLALPIAALIALAGLAVAPWAAIGRETGSRATLLLLPERTFDFTGRTEAIAVAGMPAFTALLVALLVAIALAPFAPRRWARPLALGAGIAVIVTAAVGVARVDAAVQGRRAIALQQALAPAIANPTANQDAVALARIAAEAERRPITESVERARAAGVIVRRLPYGGGGAGLAPFLSVLAGLLAIAVAARALPAVIRVQRAVAERASVPAVAILLALLVAAGVIALLQPTPIGRDVAITSPAMAFAGRIDTLWHAYVVLFAASLGTAKGFFDALSFATPLIFTGLAVGVAFRSGAFNIGAPGQMIWGAIGAAMVGLYLPGPRLLVLPAALLAAALAGAAWGAIPGYLKARFGANEVINTILLNFVAASALLFLLSSAPTFAASAVRVFALLAVVVAVAAVALLLPPYRRFVRRAPRAAFALALVVALLGAVIVAQPRPDDRPVVIALPFKVPGSEPKSYEIRPEARLPRLPAAFGIDLRATPGPQVVRVDAAPWIAFAAALLVALAVRLPFARRALVAAAAGALAFAFAALLGARALPITIPPTNLTAAFALALAAAAGIWFLLFRTRFGYEIRAIGLAPKAAEYGGVNVARTTVAAMALSGALAGLTASHYVLGGALEDYALRQALPTGDGFDGIAVALLGGNHPLGIVLAAFLFGVLKNGGSLLNIAFSDLTRDVVSMILALVVLFIAAKGFLPTRFTDPLRAPQRDAETER
jgi:general nucleoside transport system permease protein